MSVNKVIGIGRLGDDPKHFTEMKNPLTVLSVATSESYIDKKTNQKKEVTEWHRVEVWGNLATICNKFLSKGSQIYYEGPLKYKEYKNKEGVLKHQAFIKANTVQFLSSNKAKEKKNQVEKTNHSNIVESITTDEIPF